MSVQICQDHKTLLDTFMIITWLAWTEIDLSQFNTHTFLGCKDQTILIYNREKMVIIDNKRKQNLSYQESTLFKRKDDA